MKTFTDNAGRTWTLAVNVDAIKRVRDLAGVNLLEVIEGKLIEKLVADPVLLCDVVYCLGRARGRSRGSARPALVGQGRIRANANSRWVLERNDSSRTLTRLSA